MPPFLFPLVAFLSRSETFGPLLNRFLINRFASAARNRPHPWSTAHPYVSWVSLSDKSYSARHLPEAEGIEQPDIDALLALFKQSDGQRLSTHSTCLFPAFAQYLTDGFIRSGVLHPDPVDRTTAENLRNTSTHNIDLCTLYGRNAAQTRQLRTLDEAADRRGRLLSQELNKEEHPPFYFRDGRPDPAFDQLDPPLFDREKVPSKQQATIFAVGGDRVNTAPQVVMINTLLLREHNRLAGEIVQAHPDWDDERVFQTTRNTLIVLFIKIVIEEYISHIGATPFRFRADPSVAWNKTWNREVWITTEFSLLYRWHSLVPATLRWGDKTLPVHDTLHNNALLIARGLVGAFEDMSAQPSGRLGPFNTPTALLGIEADSIRQGRMAKLETYARYRDYIGLPMPSSFADISQDPRVQEVLEQCYSSPREVEFFVGLFAEDLMTEGPLPHLIRNMVALDAFTQALTNPLLSKHVYKRETFSDVGWRLLKRPASLRALLERNSQGVPDAAYISMDLPTAS